MEGQVSSVYANLGGVEVGTDFPVRVVGAINVSPESFFRASVARGRRELTLRAQQMASEGAALLDLGAMSTAPYKHGQIDAAEERRRLVAAVQVVADAVSIPISIDTQRAEVAEAALAAGAKVVNDVSGLSADPGMGAVARSAAGVILMALERRPTQVSPMVLVRRLLRDCLARAEAAQIPKRRIVLDPGIGFFRHAGLPWDQFDSAILRDLRRLARLGHPILVGASRKSFIGKLTGRAAPDDRLHGSVAAAAIAVINGAHLIRAHDIAATVDAVRLAEALRRTP